MTSTVAQDQVILPSNVAFRVCVRGLRTRLGRSIITVAGVALGTAFLMAVAGGAIIKDALAEKTTARQEIDRRVALLRGNLGRLSQKTLLVLAVEPTAHEADFIRALAQRHHATVILFGIEDISGEGVTHSEDPGIQVDAVVCLGEYASLLQARVAASPGQAPLFTFKPAADASGTIVAPETLQHLSLQLHPDQLARIEMRKTQERYRTFWILGAALLIMTICITNAMLMSVTERIREIGTMKCLGALPGFVVRLFLIESALIGVSGAVIGALAGISFAIGGYAYVYGLLPVLASLHYGQIAFTVVCCVLAGITLASIAGIYPARVASRMIPAAALASHV